MSYDSKKMVTLNQCAFFFGIVFELVIEKKLKR